MVNELLEVSKGLPAVYPQAEKFGRHATSLMCLAVRSILFVLAASPLVNGNAIKGSVNKDGVELFQHCV